MRTIAASKSQIDLVDIVQSAQIEPLVLREDQREAVVLSMDEYKRLRGLDLDAFRQFCDRVGREAEARGMTEEVLQDILRND
jgi:hypothetical protein